MRIGGLQKNSFIDFPGKMSCVVFLKGCNFRCPYCHNPELVEGGADADPWDEGGLYDFLATRKEFLDGVVISGGEPTVQSGLPRLCRNIKAMGYPLKLDTNGSRPQVLERLVAEGLVDYLAVDIKTEPLRYRPYFGDGDGKAVLASMRIVMESERPYEFRTTCVKPFVDKKVIETIARTLQGARLYILQRFRPSRVLNPSFFKEKGRGCNEEELRGFQSIAARRVKTCIVR